MNDKKLATSTYAAPIGVGMLLLLYGLGLWLMSDDEANPALVLLAAVLGVAAIGYGLYRRERTRN